MQQITRAVMVMISLQFALASSLWAFAVGDIVVHSRHGEPFAAEIRLLLEAHERDKGVEVTLGNQETYRAEGLKRPAVIDTLRAGPPPGTRNAIRLSSTGAIQESAFDLVLSVRAGQVTIVKHYHVALPVPAPAASQVLAPRPTIAPVASVAQAPKATPKAARPPRRTGRYGPVAKGDTLYSVAKGLHVPNDKLWQAVVVLWQVNKGQFQGGNLHGLPVGTFLEVPSDLVEQMAAMRLAEAQEIVATQWEEWHTLQRSGLGKQRVIAATGDTDTPAPASTKQDAAAAAKQEVTMPPTEHTAPKAVPAQGAMVLPVGKPGNMVSMAELHTVLQGLEERLMRRLTPTAQAQDVDMPTALVSASELQASIQSLEERLTQRMQHMLAQTPEPVRVGPRPLQQAAAAQPTLAVEAAQPASLFMVPYLLMVTNALLLVLVGAFVWFWFRRRDRLERMQGV